MPRIGLEVHVHLNTLRTKLFCSCSSAYEEKSPNSDTCPTCLGLPGGLPVLNKEAVRKAVMLAYSLNMEVSNVVAFSRKHYFYPDMAKNYQITQYDGPGSTAIAYNGYLKLNNREVRIRRINIEEDPAKTVYPTGSIMTSPYTLLDYNRSGIGLLEIVTEPDMETPEEATEFLEKLRSIIEHLEVCDCSREGSMRADCNVSVEDGERVEVKNVGSIKEAKRAISYEIARQRALVGQGLSVRRETRHWDTVRGVTVAMRVKETEEDYRYFPDPDLPPMYLDSEYLTKIKERMPELPEQRSKRFVKEYKISDYTAGVLVDDKRLADLFEATVKLYNEPVKVANLLTNDYLRWIREKDLEVSSSLASPEKITKLLKLLQNNVITIKVAKDLLPLMITQGIDPEEYVKRMNLVAIGDDSLIIQVVDQVLSENREVAEKAKSDTKAINFLVGMVMKKTGKRADPKTVYELIKARINP